MIKIANIIASIFIYIFFDNKNERLNYLEKTGKELSVQSQIIIIIFAILLSAGIGFSIYCFLFKKKKKNR